MIFVQYNSFDIVIWVITIIDHVDQQYNSYKSINEVVFVQYNSCG